MPPSPPSNRALWAYVGPFGLFVLLLALPGLIPHPAARTVSVVLPPEFWVYPLQTLLCGAMLFYYRREYPRAFGPMASFWGIGVGLAVFVLWISPQAFFHGEPRVDGFNPTLIRDAGPAAPGKNFAYEATVALRFARLVIVVPLLEEVFWRGFLLRFLVKEDFLSLPFGSWTPLSFGIVTAGFMFEHHPADWPAALATGVLYNLVAVRTRSLPACVLAHALTNLLLGLYVMHTRQWGFW